MKIKNMKQSEKWTKNSKSSKDPKINKQIKRKLLENVRPGTKGKAEWHFGLASAQRKGGAPNPFLIHQTRAFLRRLSKPMHEESFLPGRDTRREFFIHNISTGIEIKRANREASRRGRINNSWHPCFASLALVLADARCFPPRGRFCLARCQGQFVYL